MVDNPEFEYGKLGWKCNTGAQNQLIAHNQTGAITDNFFESWDANSYTGEIYQERNVPNGTYRLTAAAFRSQLISGGRQDAEAVYLFANEQTCLINNTTPDTYSVTVYVTDGHLRFGLRSVKKNFRWMGIDNVSLMYYGEQKLNADEIDYATRNSAIYLRNQRDGKFLNAGQSWGTQAILSEHPLDIHLIALTNGKYALDTRINNGGGNHYAGSNGYLDGALTPFNIKWLDDSTIALNTNGTSYWGSTGGKTVSTSLSSYAKGAHWDVLTYDDLMSELLEATHTSPVDATFLIQCHNFGRNDTRISSWQGDSFETGGEVNNQCAKAPIGKFDIYQTISGIPNGFYSLRMQGFTRSSKALLYANNNTTVLKDIGDETGSQPTTLETASSRFTSGKYVNELTFEVNNGKLTLGIKKTSNTTQTDEWTVFDNFELTYFGAEPNDINNIIIDNDKMAGTTSAVFNLKGDKINMPLSNYTPGIYIINKNNVWRKILVK